MSADYTKTLTVAASPAAVRAALTTTEVLSAWWVTASGDGRAGGELTFRFDNGFSLLLRVDAASADRVQWTAVSYEPLPEWSGTTIEFDIAPTADGTRIDFRHRGLTAELECFDMCHRGWDNALATLARRVESTDAMLSA